MSEDVIYLNGIGTPAPQPGARLLDWIRDHAGDTSPKEGCAAGHCGTCTVLVDGRSAPSCCMLVHAALGKQVWTAAGLTTTALGRRVCDKFSEYGAVQCGFCAPGMTVAAVGWLTHRTGGPAERSEVAAALSGNVCRCSGYAQLLDALTAAALGTREVA